MDTRRSPSPEEESRHESEAGSPVSDSFVVWLDPPHAAEPEHCQGTVEHVPSARRVRFASGVELLTFLRSTSLSILLGVVLLAPGSALAQLIGKYTVGGADPDYASLADAVAALQSAGVSGPVTLSLRAGTHTGGGGSERALYISSAIPGASAESRIVIQPDSATSATREDVVLERSSGADSGGYVVDIRSGHVTLRQVSVRHLGGSIGAVVSIGLADTGEDVSVEGCVVEGAGVARQGVEIQRARDVRVLDNLISGVGDGVAAGGFYQSYTLRIEGNEIRDFTTYSLGGTSYGAGIRLDNVHDPVVRRNILDYGGEAPGHQGVALNQARRFLLEGNEVRNVITGGLYGMFTGIHVRGSVSSGRVVNNMVSVYSVRRSGIYIQADDIVVAHNTVMLPRRGIDLFGGSRAFELYGERANVVNNIFYEAGTGANVYAMFIGVDPATSEFDGNLLWSSDVLVQADRENYDLAGWQALGFGASSIRKSTIEVVNQYSNLHLEGCSALDPELQGIPFAQVTGDLDGDPRPAEGPLRGADEALGGIPPVFGAPSNVPVGDLPGQVAAGDFDGDGDRDLVVSRISGAGEPSLALLENQGGGSFAPAGEIKPIGTDTPLIVRAGDLDGNGRADVAVSFDGTEAPYLMFFWDDGPFAFEARAAPTEHPFEDIQADWISDFELVDLDGDDDLDIVATHLGVVDGIEDPGALMVICNTAERTLVPMLIVPLDNPYELEVGDFDGNGDPDVAVQQFDGSLVVVRNRLGSCQSLDEVLPVAGPGSVDSAPLWPSMAAADFDGDGDVDLVYDALDASDSITLRRNRGDATFEAAESIFVGGLAERLPGPLTSLDVEKDGDIDLLVGNERGNFPGQSVLLTNDGAGEFVRILVCGESELPSPPRMLLASDLDGDSLPDFVAVTTDPDDISVVLGTGHAPPPAVIAGLVGEPVRHGTMVELRWSTLLEIDIDGFEVQTKGWPDLGWQITGTLYVDGTSSEPQHYVFEDDIPYWHGGGRTVYRLRVLDGRNPPTYSEELTVWRVPEPGAAATGAGALLTLWWLARRRRNSGGRGQPRA